MYTYAHENDSAVVTEEVVAVHHSTRYGEILVNRAGYALYTYDKDTTDHSNCLAFCLHLWPPLTVARAATPTGGGVRGLGAFTTPGGTRQVTYRGAPLYTFAFDQPGRVTGVGNGWSVVRVSP